MHKKIMSKAANALIKDAKEYKKESTAAKKKNQAMKAKHERIEQREAMSAANDLKKRAKKAHEY